jgi:assimilatory nitrate reductase catalytic subunit
VGASLIWRRTMREDCQLHEFAGRGDEVERNWVAKRLSAGAQGEMLSLDDTAIGAFRRAWIVGDRLDRVLFISQGKLPSRDWLTGLFHAPEVSAPDRVALLAGRSLGPVEDVGPVVCACLRVGARTIEKACAGGAASVEAVGAATGAGTNCGSCRVEIARILSSKEMAHAA